MSHLKTIPESELDSSSVNALKPFRMKGNLAEVYLQIANSEESLKAYLEMELALRASSLSDREIEAVKLLVSQINRCNYCLSIHQFKASAAGFNETELLAIRKAQPIGDDRIDQLTSLVQTVFKSPGELSENQLQALRSVGFTDADLVDIALAITTIFFTNIFNHINKTSSPLPPAPALDRT